MTIDLPPELFPITPNPRKSHIPHQAQSRYHRPWPNRITNLQTSIVVVSILSFCFIALFSLTSDIWTTISNDTNPAYSTDPIDLSFGSSRISKKNDVIIFNEDPVCGREHAKYQYIDIFGQYYTGTNALYHHLKANCDNMTIRFQSKVGKHKMRPSVSDLNNEQLFPQNASDFRRGLHVVLIRDPLTWQMSVCKRPYGIHIKERQTWYRNGQCPRGISEMNGTARFDSTCLVVLESIRMFRNFVNCRKSTYFISFFPIQKRV